VTANTINLKITCKSCSDPDFYGGGSFRGRSQQQQNATEVVVFTRELVTTFPLQCGLRLTVDDIGFIVKGEAEAGDDAITFRSSTEKNYNDSRITYVRKWRKETYKKLLAEGWAKEVVQEAVKQ